ncbi:hypothetical protein [Bacillus testis]|nr:hypothetical protein [Bacillus testis]
MQEEGRVKRQQQEQLKLTSMEEDLKQKLLNIKSQN